MKWGLCQRHNNMTKEQKTAEWNGGYVKDTMTWPKSRKQLNEMGVMSKTQWPDQRAENSWRPLMGLQHSQKSPHLKGGFSWPLNKICTSSTKMDVPSNSKTYKWTIFFKYTRLARGSWHWDRHKNANFDILLFQRIGYTGLPLLPNTLFVTFFSATMLTEGLWASCNVMLSKMIFS